MKSFILTIALLSASISSFAQDEKPTTKEVVAIASELFVPNGFDSNTDAYVVVSGVFPNGCYRWNRAEIKHTSSQNHEIVVIANVRSGICPRMLLPYSEEVRLGKLQSGEHSLRMVNGDGTFFEKKMVIE